MPQTYHCRLCYHKCVCNWNVIKWLWSKMRSNTKKNIYADEFLCVVISGKKWAPEKNYFSLNFAILFMDVLRMKIVYSTECGFNFPAHGLNYGASTHKKTNNIKRQYANKQKMVDIVIPPLVTATLIVASFVMHSFDGYFRSKDTNQIFGQRVNCIGMVLIDVDAITQIFALTSNHIKK